MITESTHESIDSSIHLFTHPSIHSFQSFIDSCFLFLIRSLLLPCLTGRTKRSTQLSPNKNCRWKSHRETDHLQTGLTASRRRCRCGTGGRQQQGYAWLETATTSLLQQGHSWMETATTSLLQQGYAWLKTATTSLLQQRGHSWVETVTNASLRQQGHAC